MASRRDYVKVADLLAGQLALSRTLSNHGERVAAVEQVVQITYSLGDLFVQDNPRFDRDRFYQAVGIGRLHGDRWAATADDGGVDAERGMSQEWK
jgi:hypothetical protein